MFYKNLEFGLLEHILTFFLTQDFISSTIGNSALWKSSRHYRAFYTHCFAAIVQIDGWELVMASQIAAHACWIQWGGYPPRPRQYPPKEVEPALCIKIEACQQAEERPPSMSSKAAPRWAGTP